MRRTSIFKPDYLPSSLPSRLRLHRVRPHSPLPSSDPSPGNTVPIPDHLRYPEHHYPLALHLLPYLPSTVPLSTSTASSPSFLTTSWSPLLLPTKTPVPLPMHQLPLWCPPSSARQLPLPLQRQPIRQLDSNDASRQLVSMFTPDPSPLSSLALFSLSLLILSSAAFQPPSPAASPAGSGSSPPQESHHRPSLVRSLPTWVSRGSPWRFPPSSPPPLPPPSPAWTPIFELGFQGPRTLFAAELHHRRPALPLNPLLLLLSPHETRESPWVGTEKMSKV